MSALDTLNAVNGTIQIASVVEGVVIPIFIGLVKDVKALLNENGEIEYTVALTQGEKNIVDGLASFTDSLNAINRERAVAGLPPITIPGQ